MGKEPFQEQKTSDDVPFQAMFIGLFVRSGIAQFLGGGRGQLCEEGLPTWAAEWRGEGQQSGRTRGASHHCLPALSSGHQLCIKAENEGTGWRRDTRRLCGLKIGM